MKISKVDNSLEMVIEKTDNIEFISDFFSTLKIEGKIFRKNGTISKIKITKKEEEEKLDFFDDIDSFETEEIDLSDLMGHDS